MNFRSLEQSEETKELLRRVIACTHNLVSVVIFMKEKWSIVEQSYSHFKTIDFISRKNMAFWAKARNHVVVHHINSSFAGTQRRTYNDITRIKWWSSKSKTNYCCRSCRSRQQRQLTITKWVQKTSRDVESNMGPRLRYMGPFRTCSRYITVINIKTAGMWRSRISVSKVAPSRRCPVRPVTVWSNMS